MSARVTIVGASKSGKSWLTSYLVDRDMRVDPGRRIIVASTRPDLTEWARARYFKRALIDDGATIDPADILAQPRSIVVYRGVSDKQLGAHFTALLDELNAERGRVGTLLVIDEMMEFVLGMRAMGGFAAATRLYRGSAHLNLSIYASTQRPCDTPPTLISQSEWIVAFRLTEHNDRQRMATWIGRADAEKLASIGRRRCIILNTSTGERAELSTEGLR